MADADHSSDSFSVALTDTGDRRLVAVTGEIDAATGPRLEACIEQALALGPPVVIDLSRATFVDSTGVTVFLRAYFAAGQVPEAVVLAGATGAVRRTLDMTRIADAMTVRDDVGGDESDRSVSRPEPDPQG